MLISVKYNKGWSEEKYFLTYFVYITNHIIEYDGFHFYFIYF